MASTSDIVGLYKVYADHASATQAIKAEQPRKVLKSIIATQGRNVLSVLLTILNSFHSILA